VTPDQLMGKATRAVASARLLLNDGDVNGACNRAYYAMFDAARAALLVLVPGIDPALVKTHGGLISMFSLHFVKPGILPVELGRSLNRAHEVRLIADYVGEEVSVEQARSVIEHAALFTEAIRAHIRNAPLGGE